MAPVADIAVRDRPFAEQFALVCLLVVGALWVFGALVDSPVFFQPALFGLGTGAVIAAIALGLVVA